MAELIKVEGIKQFQAKLKAADGESQKQLRLVFNEAANIVADKAKPMVPVRSGKAAGSVKAQSSQRAGKVKAGGARVPYYGWLDFGGSTGKKRSVRRPFLKDGRYIYPAYDASRDKVFDELARGLAELIKKSGLD